MKRPVRSNAPRGSESDRARCRAFLAGQSAAFTLIELILVMAILAAVLAVSSPALGRFFRGRNLDAEAYRLLSLTRYAQERAVTEGIPMILWLDTQARRYGLMADPTWSLAPSGSRAGTIATMAVGNDNTRRSVLQDDARACEFGIADDVEFEVQTAVIARPQGSLDIRETPIATRPILRFQPDGFLPISGPEWIEVRPRTTDTSESENFRLWIAPGVNRQAYEIWTNQPPIERR